MAGRTYMLKLWRQIGIVAIRHQKRIRHAVKRSLQRSRIIDIRFERLASNSLKGLSRGAGCVPRNGADTVRLRGFPKGFDHGSTLYASRTDNNEEREKSVLRYHDVGVLLC